MKISELTQYLIEDLETNQLINTLTFDRTTEIDYNRSNIYPLVNIDPQYLEIENGGLRVNFVINVLMQRNDNNHANKSKLFKDNLIDNISESTVIANKIIQKIHMHPEITLNNTPFLNIVKHSRGNILDGVEFNLNLLVANEC